MRIRPWVVTGAGTLLAGAAGAIVIAVNDPYAAEPTVRWMFWLAVGLFCWGGSTTLLLMVRRNLPQSVWTGFVLTAAVVGMVVLWHAGHRDRRLLGGLVFATLFVSFFTAYHTRERA